jgi:Glycosyltransferase
MQLPKNKIVLFTDCFIFGGSENLLINLSNYDELRKSFDIKILYPNNKWYREIIEQIIGNAAELLPLNLLSYESIIYYISNKYNGFIVKIAAILLFVPKKILFQIWNFVIIYLALKRIKPDILHINNGGYPGARSCRTAVLCGKINRTKRIVFTINNLAKKRKGLFESLIDVYINTHVDKFVTASLSAKQRLIINRLFTQAKIDTIPNTIFNDECLVFSKNQLRNEFNLSQEMLIIGSAGLLTKRKGYNVLINSIYKIKLKFPQLDFKVFIFGEGEDKCKLTELINQFELQDNIILAGYRKEILGYMSDFDIFVLPSIDDEDLPYVNLEAMLLGKPLIGTKVAGIVQQIDQNINGILINPNNSEELSEALIALMGDKEKRIKMGENSSLKYWEQFNYKMTMNKYYQLYQSLVKEDDLRSNSNE